MIINSDYSQITKINTITFSHPEVWLRIYTKINILLRQVTHTMHPCILPECCVLLERGCFISLIALAERQDLKWLLLVL
jgi:hypothetical protein